MKLIQGLYIVSSAVLFLSDLGFADDRFPRNENVREIWPASAPPEDVSLANTYRSYRLKGRITHGKRITIMTHKKKYKVGETVRVLHVLEVVEPGRFVDHRGPAEIYSEYVDGKLATSKSERPELSGVFNGGNRPPSPAINFNFMTTSYVFTVPGPHRIQWRMVPGEFESNSLVVQVVK